MQMHMTRNTSQVGPGDDLAADEDFSREDGGDEPLRQMPNLVVIVALQVEVVANPIEERHVGIRVVGADEQDARVEGDEPVGQPREWEAAPGNAEEGDRDEGGEGLQPPGHAVCRANP